MRKGVSKQEGSHNGTYFEFMEKIGSLGMRIRMVNERFAKKRRPEVWW